MYVVALQDHIVLLSFVLVATFLGHLRRQVLNVLDDCLAEVSDALVVWLLEHVKQAWQGAADAIDLV